VHSWALVATLAVSFALLSALLAYLFGRRISDPVRALVEGARALGRGEAVGPIDSSIREVRAVGEALAKASETRQLMERSLRESEDRLRLALASADTGTWDWDLKGGNLTWISECASYGVWGQTIPSHSTSSSRRSTRSTANRRLPRSSVHRMR
jgi:PAS domain-containing protein